MSNLQRAADHLDAIYIGPRQWAYWAEETGRYYVLASDDLESLVEYLDSDDDQIAGDAYSHWCAGTTAREMPKGWEPA